MSAGDGGSGNGKDLGDSKEALQRRLTEAQNSISETVSEIKDTVEDGVDSVKKTLRGVAHMREGFAKEPLVWGLGTLAAGFALGYAVGYAHKKANAKKNRSQIAAFANTVMNELSGAGSEFVLPRLNKNIEQLFGIGLSALLEQIQGPEEEHRPSRRRTRSSNPDRTRTRGGRGKEEHEPEEKGDA